MDKPIINTKRIGYFDSLKTLSIIAVVISHASCYYLTTTKPLSASWFISLFYNSISSYAVAIFLMVNGALLLNKNYSFFEIIKKYIIKYFLVLLIFKSIYKIANYIPYHLWYLEEIIIIYFLLAFANKIKDNKSTIYFGLFIFVLLSIILFRNPLIRMDDYLFLDILRHLGYLTYMILGYKLSKITKVFNKRILFNIFILSTLVKILLTYYLYKNLNINHIFPAFENISLLTLLQGVCLFLCIKEYKHKNIILTKLSSILSTNTLNIYLIHVLILNNAINAISLAVTNYFLVFIYINLLLFIVLFLSLFYSIYLNKILNYLYSNITNYKNKN